MAIKPARKTRYNSAFSIPAQGQPATAAGAGFYQPPARRPVRARYRVEIESPRPPAPVPPKLPTAEELQQVKPGTTEEQLLALGAFSSRITIPEEGHMIKLYHYPGVLVRLDNGVVVSVR